MAMTILVAGYLHHSDQKIFCFPASIWGGGGGGREIERERDREREREREGEGGRSFGIRINGRGEEEEGGPTLEKKRFPIPKHPRG